MSRQDLDLVLLDKPRSRIADHMVVLLFIF